MAPWGAEGYWLVRLLLQRGLAVVYLVAFLAASRQFRPLAGEEGLVRLGEYVESTAFRERPSLYQFLPYDRAIGIAGWSGVVSALAALVAGRWLASLFSPGAVPWLAGVGLAVLGVGGVAAGIEGDLDY